MIDLLVVFCVMTWEKKGLKHEFVKLVKEKKLLGTLGLP